MSQLLKKVRQGLGNFFSDVKGDSKEQLLLMIEDEMEKRAKRLAKQGSNLDADGLMQSVMTKPYFIQGCAEYHIATTEVREIARIIAKDYS